MGAQVFNVNARRAASQDRDVLDFQEDDNQTTQMPTDSRRAQFSLQSNAISFDLQTWPEVDYWEVDPAWDGKLFRSAAQAVRPLRRGQIQNHLELPFRVQDGTVCARIVQADGQQIQLQIEMGSA